MKPLYILLFVASVMVPGAGTTADNAAPTLHFDSKGRLVLVVTSDGRRCAYHYGPDGRLLPPSDSTCGAPEEWLKAGAKG